MLKKIFSFTKKLLGKNLTNQIRPLGHGIKTYLASLYFGFPAKKLKLIGITGTKGKTSTTILTARLLNKLGIKTGFISSAVIFDGIKEIANPYHMGTIDGYWLQKNLTNMVKNGCKMVILEITSIGLSQNRHWGLGKFDTSVLLNMYPEHLDNHGGWENYKAAKSILFKILKPNGTAIINKTAEQTEVYDFMIKALQNQTFQNASIDPETDIEIIDKSNSASYDVKIDNEIYQTPFVAPFEVKNFYFAYQICKKYIDKIDPKSALESLPINIPGRMDFAVKTDEIDILVDYAHEPESMKQLLQTLQTWKQKGLYDCIVHLVSSDGAGRDTWKIPVLGKTSFDLADFSILTTDNYEAEDNPSDILDLLEKDLDKSLIGKKYIRELNRKNAFELAIKKAKKRDKKTIIVSTGVGSEAFLFQPNGKLDWNEKEVWKEVYENLEKEE